MSQRQREGVPMTSERDGATIGVREYAESYLVHLNEVQIADGKIVDVGGERRFVLEARNEGGHNSTLVDLEDLLLWLHDHRPDLLVPIAEMALNENIDTVVKEAHAGIDALAAEFQALSAKAISDFEAGAQAFLHALVAVGVTQDQLARATEIAASKFPVTPPVAKE